MKLKDIQNIKSSDLHSYKIKVKLKINNYIEIF